MTDSANPLTPSLSQDELSRWQPDVLGAGYDCMVIPLGDDPDGEGEVVATLVRYTAGMPAKPKGVVLYVHGMSDYFFQKHVAEHFAGNDYAFYALDLRKCGRSRLEGHTPHYVSSLSLYDADLDSAMRVIRSAHGEPPVVPLAHSTGGLVVPLWLSRRRRRLGPAGTEGFRGMILNSPFFDLPAPLAVRTLGTAAAEAIGSFWGKRSMPRESVDDYGASLHVSMQGDWDYNLDWKPLTGFPVRFGWLRAIRRGHLTLHRGLDLDVPALILRSKLSKTIPDQLGHPLDVADLVLDVRQIQRWSGSIGDRTTIVPIVNARHDVFLSAEIPRNKAFREVDRWLANLEE